MLFQGNGSSFIGHFLDLIGFIEAVDSSELPQKNVAVMPTSRQ
jgi:hypothetical protein